MRTSPLSLDANVLVELLRSKNERVRARFSGALAARQPMTVSLIVLHELLFGAELSSRPVMERAAVRRLLAAVRRLLAAVDLAPFDAADMLAAARLRATLKQRGRPMGPFDLLIAGQALARDWTIVSGDARAFAGIDGLAVIDWSREAV